MRSLLLLCFSIAVVAGGCSPAQQDSTAADTIANVVIEAKGDEGDPAEPDTTNTLLSYEITDGYNYIIDPFEFNLDSATIAQLLGVDATILSKATAPGEDEMGAYDGYTYYNVTMMSTRLNFYSYPGKFYADVYTPKVPFKKGVVVGMSITEFIAAMGLPADTKNVNTFFINENFGSMRFNFYNDTLRNIYVSYEEGD